MRRTLLSTLLAVVSVAGACASLRTQPEPTHPQLSADDRLNILRRSQVWAPTDVASMNLTAGPQGPGAFAPRETVTCDYVERDMGGSSPKFTCAIPAKAGTPGSKPDEVKVKFGLGNAEVYGEVASTRLLWALGFGADRMYPVRVVCRGCPEKYKSSETLPSGDRVFDPAVIERKAAGKTIESKPDQGWSWKELDLVAADAGGASVAERDALKLIAVILQHGDNKSQQQRLVCLDPGAGVAVAGNLTCTHPFMLINDVGLTWGHVDMLNRNALEGVNFARWVRSPVWKAGEGCVGNLTKALTATLGDPTIGEAGRMFLADLLGRLSDAQIHDMFAVAQVTLRASAPNHLGSAETSVDMWVSAFKQKRTEVTERRCGAAMDPFAHSPIHSLLPPVR
jgi:hypothetical protein